MDPKLAARMDASLAAYWGAYGLAGGARRRELPGALEIYTPIPLYLFNTVILTGQDQATLEAALDGAAAFIAERGGPVMWRLSPTAVSEAVTARLLAAGLEPHHNDPALLCDLSTLPEAPRIGGFEIRTAEGKAGRFDWAWLTCDAFELGAEVREAMSRCEAAIPEERFASDVRYIGYLDGAPVAVSSLVMAGGLAGIYAVATLPEARNRGVGTAMTLHAMAEGRQRGAAAAVLQATEMGQPVYERLGFRVVYDYATYLQH